MVVMIRMLICLQFGPFIIKVCNCPSLAGAIKGVTKVLVCFGDTCNKDLNVNSLYLTASVIMCLYRLLHKKEV